MSKSPHLPEYLRTSYDASPAEQAAVIRGNVRFTVIAPRLIRMEEGAFTDAATQAVIRRDLGRTAFTVSETAGVLTLDTGELKLEYRIGEKLSAESLSIRYKAGRAENIWRYGEAPVYGLGGTVSTLDQVNGDCAIEPGVCSRDGFGLMDDSGSALFREDGWFKARKPGTDLYFFGYGHDYPACVRDYCRLTGAPSLLPAFVFGNWWSRYHRYTADEYLDLMDNFHAHDIPLSVGIVDMDWHLTDGDGREYWTDGWTGYTWNRDLFPDPQAFLKGLGERNLKTALNLHPASGVRSFEEPYRAMAEARGVDPDSGKPVPCDYLDPGFWAAYFEVLHFPMERDGVHFWWMDWQQGTDYRSLVGEENYTPSDLESMNPLWLMNHMHYLASLREGGRGLIFSRYCGHGSQRYPIGFSGDSVISWESLDFQPRFTVAASNVGYGWWSHDIGGHHKGYRDDELTVRWIQFGVFSPIFRLHSTSNVFLGREPWNYEPRSEGIITRWMRLRHRLFPYLYTMNRRATAELIPLMQPMYYSHPEADEAYQVPNEYWFGDQMIVSPVTAKGDPVSGFGAAKAWLPDGLWTDAFTGTVYHGGETLTMHRYRESIPVLLKAGAIVPLQDHVPGSNALGRAKAMTLVLAPGADGSFILYEDDGVSDGWTRDAFAETEFTLAWEQESAAVLTVRPARGDLSLIPEARSYTLRLPGFRKDTAVLLGDRTAVPTFTEPRTGCLLAELPESPVSGEITVLLQNPAGLTDRGADTHDRCVDLLTRAQCALIEKDQLLERLDYVCGRISAGEPFAAVYHLLSPGFDDRLYGAIRELVREWALAGAVPFEDTTTGHSAPPHLNSVF